MEYLKEAIESLKEADNVAGVNGANINSPNDQAVWLSLRGLTYAILQLVEDFKQEESYPNVELGFVGETLPDLGFMPSDVEEKSGKKGIKRTE